MLGFPSLHTEGFQQASRWKLIENGCGRTVSSGCRTDVTVAGLQFDTSQAADAGSSAYSNAQERNLAAALDGNDRRPSILGAMEVGHDDGNLQSITG